MSYLVARMQKMKSQNLGGIQKHNQREFENHSNEEINKDLSYLNFDLVNPENINYREKIMNIINEQRESTRAIRKDAVLVNEWVITSDQDFFKEKDLAEVEKFFKESAEFFKERYGDNNLAYAQVHLDETTPHMHLGVVPMRDGSLQAKNVFNRKELLAIQEELPRYLKVRGFDIERGEPNGARKHLTVDEFKDMQSRLAEMAVIEEERKKSIELLKNEKNKLEEKIEDSKEYLRMSEEIQGVPMVSGAKRVEMINDKPVEVYTISADELFRLNRIRINSNNVLAENKAVKQENQLLNKENETLKNNESTFFKARNQMSQILERANAHSEKLSPGTFERSITFAKQFYKNEDEYSVNCEKDRMLESIKESPLGLEDYIDWNKKRRDFERNRLQR